MKRGSRSAFSLVEVMLAMAITGLLLVVLGEALSQAQAAFRNVVGTSEAADELRKVNMRIRQELMQTSALQIASGTSATSLVAPDGQTLWFLSNLGPDGTPQFLADGSPFWLRNILYYITIPNNHLGLFGWNCTGGAGPFGLDDRCPHKMLIRNEIDFGPVTDGTNEANVEALMTVADINPYLTRPAGYSVSAMSLEPGVKFPRIVGRNLLSFVIVPGAPGSITVDTRAVSIARARHKVSLGNASMFNSPFTSHFSITVVPSVP